MITLHAAISVEIYHLQMYMLKNGTVLLVMSGIHNI